MLADAAQALEVRPRRDVILLVDCLEAGKSGPFEPGSEGEFLLRLGSLLAAGSGGRLRLFSVVPVPPGESASIYTVKAQARRQEIEQQAVSVLYPGESARGEKRAHPTHGVQDRAPVSLVSPVVRVAPEGDVASEVRRFVLGEERALALLPLKRFQGDECPWLAKALRGPVPCDIAWARPPLAYIRAHSHAAHGKGAGGAGGEGRRGKKGSSGTPGSVGTPDTLREASRVLVPARGGPQAALALELSQNLMEAIGAQVRLLHILQEMPERARAGEEAPFAELLSSYAPGRGGSIEAHRTTEVGGDPVATIVAAAAEHDITIMGTGAGQSATLGRFTRRVAAKAEGTLIAVKSRIPVGPAIRAARRRARPHALDPESLSLLVDKWFAENTFHAREFSDLGRLVDLKRKTGQTISLGLPTLNEEATIGPIITTLRAALVEEYPLLDEIVVIDSNSTDGTHEIARGLGVPVYVHGDVLTEVGEPLVGKGEALWKSLHVLKGDLVAWVDTDVSDMDPRFVYGLLGPLLREPRLGYVKGYYHRPIRAGGHLQHEGGGRVTELTVRPLINLFFPLLSGLVQPLAGEYAGRREVLEKLPFFSGYGVEMGLLIDLLEQFGLSSIGQVNLERRIHRNRSLADLSLTAFAIVQVILTRLEERASIRLLEEVNRSMKLIRFEDDHLSLVVRRVRDRERPPISTIPAYRTAHPEG